MAEQLIVNENNTKEDKYKTLLPQLKALLEGETDSIAIMANVSAALKSTFNFLWVGFYQVKRDQLVLGPFQGAIACIRINYGKGVCGTAWKEKRTVVVSDVNQFPGHIACDAHSQSEIVVPIFYKQEVIAVLDIDSESLSNFDNIDALYLQQIADMIVDR